MLKTVLLFLASCALALTVGFVCPADAVTIQSLSFGTPFGYNAGIASVTATMVNGSPTFTITSGVTTLTAGTPISYSTTADFPSGTTITVTCTTTCTASNNWAGTSGSFALSTYYHEGDTFFNSWCSTVGTGVIDGTVNTNVYSWINDQLAFNYDGVGLGASTLTQNMATAVFTNMSQTTAESGGLTILMDSTNIANWGSWGETDTTTAPYGGTANSGAQSSPDYANWKTAGMLCINSSGTDYLFGIAARTIYEANSTTLAAYTSAGIYPWGQPAFNAQMITESETAGAGTGNWSGWTPTPPSKAYHFISPEWPSLNGGVNPANTFAAGFIQYGQGYSCQWAGFTGCTTLPDGANTYVYGVFPREGYAYGSSTMGIGRATVANLIAHVASPQASDWTYFNNADNNNSCTDSNNWTSTIGSAVAIAAEPNHMGLAQPVYLPNVNGNSGTGIYIMPIAYFLSNVVSTQLLDADVAKSATGWWQAPTPCGPWTKFQTSMNNPTGVYFPIIASASITANSATFQVLNGQNYLNSGVTSASTQYHLYTTLVTVTYH